MRRLNGAMPGRRFRARGRAELAVCRAHRLVRSGTPPATAACPASRVMVAPLLVPQASKTWAGTTAYESFNHSRSR